MHETHTRGRTPRRVTSAVILVGALCLVGGAVLRRGGPAGPTPRTVAVGHPIVPPVVDDASGHTFLTLYDSRGDAHIIVLDTASGRVRRTIPIVADNLNALAVDSRAGRVFLAAGACLDGACTRTAGSIRVFDARTGGLVRVVRVGPDAGALAVDAQAGRVYVGAAAPAPASCAGACPSDDGVLVALDTRRGQIVRAIPPHVQGVTQVDIALDRRGGRLVVVGYSYNGPGMVNLLDSASGRLLHTLPLTTGVWCPPVIDGATGRAFVAIGSTSGTTTTGRVDVLDSATGALVRAVPLPGGVVRLVPFAGNGSARSVSISRSHHARCSVPNMRRNFQLAVLAVDERAGRVLATTFGPAHRTVYNFAGGGGVVEMIPTGSGRLLILDARNGALVHTITTGPGTTAVAVDTRRGRVFVASTGAITPAGAYAGPGTLTVVDERRGTIVRRIPMNVNPTELTFDEQTQHLFIAYQGSPLIPPTPDPWTWMPGWLRSRLPFVPHGASRSPTASTASGGISVLDMAHL